MNYNEIRRKSNPVKVGNITIGGNAKIAIQSMTNTPAHNIAATIDQIRRLEAAGCDIVRITVPDKETVKTIYEAKNAGIRVPLVADIHFDYKVALECAAAGIDKKNKISFLS